MTTIVDWAASRARMVLVLISISLIAGGFAYGLLPKEGEPGIEIPVIFISVPFPGISAVDSERLLVKPMETELSDLDGLSRMTATAAEGYAGVALEFDFNWDKSQTVADIRNRMNNAEASFPQGAEQYSINEIIFSEFPIMIVNLAGTVPERTLLRLAKEMQDRLESLEPILEIALRGHRDEMLEVVIDPLRLESYNVTAGELINVVTNNNQLIAAGEVETDQGTFGIKIPASYGDYTDVYELPIKVSGDSVVKLGELAEIRLTFEDRLGTARYNGTNTVALQVVKRKGFNLIETAKLVREEVEAERQTWPSELRQAVRIGISNDQSFTVASMVRQLESSVLTAIALVMIVVLAALGTRAALLVGFAIPTSFLLCFAFLAIQDVAISNIVMFGLILAVGMLVDGAIVVVEYADKRIGEGSGPMHAYVEAAKRMFWPVVSSTATTLCAFLPMLFWPGVPGQFMKMLPVTLIFVLSASLVVALIYLPVMGGVAGRINQRIDGASLALRRVLPWWILRAALVPVSVYVAFIGAMQLLNPGFMTGAPGSDSFGIVAYLPGVAIFLAGAVLTAVTVGSTKIARREDSIRTGRRSMLFGRFIKLVVGNPVMPIIVIAAAFGFVVSIFTYYGQNNLGVEFFVETPPEQAIVYVRARGNLSLAEKDALIQEVEKVILSTPGIESAFASAGSGGTGGAEGTSSPADAIGQVQIELMRWEDRPHVAGTPLFGFIETETVADEYDGNRIMDELEEKLAEIPGIKTEILNLARGPASGKPVYLRLKGESFNALFAAMEIARAKFEETEGLIDIDDTLPLPGIDWQIDVDVAKAGRFGADVAAVGGMVQLVTRGIFLDTMRVDSSDEEIEIRVRLPEDYRVLATLDSLKVRTSDGQVPLSNFITRKPVRKLGQIDRVDQERYFDLRANVTPNLQKIVHVETGEARGFALPSNGDSDGGEPVYRSDLDPEEIASGLADQTLRLVPANAAERVATLAEWLETDPLPPGVEAEWAGDQEEQSESQTFLMSAFAGALGLMFIILLAQFNSFYNSVLVLLAVVLSTTGVLLGMLVMQQPFSIIMTGTGIVALAGIVVNNNIVLIDTYQEYARYMPRIEAIVRTAEARIRPVLMTTITTMAGLMPMMLGISLDFINGGYSVNAPTALWWKQLATAVVFGLGTATVLTLVVTPSMLAIRVWTTVYALAFARLLAWLSLPRSSRIARDWALKRTLRRMEMPEFVWEAETAIDPQRMKPDMDRSAGDTLRQLTPLRAAE